MILDFKSKIIIILSILLAILLWLYFAKEEVIKTVTKTVTKYDTIVNTIDNTKPQQISKITIRVTDTIKQNDTITKIVFRNKLVNKYNYVDTFENGTINETILADTIYKRDVKLTTFNKETETETIKTVVKSSFYVGGMITSELDKTIINTSVNGYYTHKNKFLLTAGLGYGIQTNKPTANIGFAIKF